MSPLPAYGSAKAQEALVEAFINWRLKQQACDAQWTDPLEAARADVAWAEMQAAAENCGWSRALCGPLTAWAPRRIRSYGKSIGVSELEIAITLGPEATNTISSIGRESRV